MPKVEIARSKKSSNVIQTKIVDVRLKKINKDMAGTIISQNADQMKLILILVLSNLTTKIFGSTCLSIVFLYMFILASTSNLGNFDENDSESSNFIVDLTAQTWIQKELI
ncbi:hypothetical protein QTP88_020640 [Uroleucon formosanum]